MIKMLDTRTVGNYGLLERDKEYPDLPANVEQQLIAQGLAVEAQPAPAAPKSKKTATNITESGE